MMKYQLFVRYACSLTLGVMVAATPAVANAQTSKPEAPPKSQPAAKPPASPKSSHDYPTRPLAPHHKKPVKVEDGRTLLWAAEDRETGEIEWFDMTDALVNPKEFQHGIGKDRIRSIDDPKFAKPGDSALTEVGIGDETDVIGFVYNGVARAYPLFIIDQAEVVNDKFDGEPFAVFW